MAYRCIGKGTTDSNGIAHITHDCNGNSLAANGYKGIGAGLINVVASTDPPSKISNGSNQSEPFPLWDTLWFDNAVNGDYNQNSIINGSPQVTRSATGTTITSQNDAWANYRPSNDGTNNLVFNTPIIVEYDIVEVDTNSRIEIYNSTSIRTATTFSSYNNPTGHYKHEVGLTNQKVYKDDTFIQETSTDFTGKNFRVDLMVWANKSITFKNMKIYPL